MNYLYRTLAGIAIMAVPALNIEARAPQASLRVPLDIPLTMSGNFGELRSNHFHSGVDFKTNARTGYPVRSAADGYVSRILVSPWGFGRAVYITHPELGLVTVYGHLEAFSPSIDAVVRPMHYELESFVLDTVFDPTALPVKRGDIIGRSGNAGSSGGPHLHMDVRDLTTGDALDGLEYYRSYVKDDVPPEVRVIALYPREGVVDGKQSPVYHSGATLSDSFTAWGRVTPGIKAYDKMTGTTNIYGVKYLTFTCDGDTIYRRVVDRVDFDKTRAVNTLVEYGDVIDSNSWVMITQVPDSHPLDGMVTARGDGTLEIYEERDYPCAFILEDEHGNRRTVRFRIRGVASNIPVTATDGELLLYDRPAQLATAGATVTIPAGTLYNDTQLDLKATDGTDRGFYSDIFSVGDRHIPLASNIELTIPVSRDTHPEKRQYCLVRLSGNNRSAVTARYENGMMKASVNRLGDYTVVVDTVAPVITPVGTSAKWGQQGKVAYKIKDSLSGIETYRGEIDGRWAMMELDGKTGTLSFVMDPRRFTRGRRHSIKVVVTDAAGNRTERRDNFTW